MVRDFADVLPLSVFLELVGLPLADREMLAAWTAETVRGADVVARQEAFYALADYLSRRCSPRAAAARAATC